NSSNSFMNSLVLAIDKKDRSKRSRIEESRSCKTSRSLSFLGDSRWPKKKTRAVAWAFEIECHAALTRGQARTLGSRHDLNMTYRLPTKQSRRESSPSKSDARPLDAAQRCHTQVVTPHTRRPTPQSTLSSRQHFQKRTFGGLY